MAGPDTPTGVVAVASTPTSVTMEWTPVADDVRTTSYSVYDGATLVGTVASTDSWTGRTLPTTAEWQVFAAGGKFIALGRRSTAVALSTNGLTWTRTTLPSSQAWCGLAYGNGTYVAVGGAGFTSTNQAATSSDGGITWIARTMSATSGWRDVAYGAGLFVAIQGGGTTSYATSPDGITWTSRSFTNNSQRNAIIFAGGKFVTVGYGVTENSVDGINWTNAASNPFTLSSVSYGGGRYVALVAGTSPYAAYSPDGSNWTPSNLPASRDWRSVAYSNGAFLAVSYSNFSTAISTDGGVTWTAKTSTSGGSLKVAGINGFFVTADCITDTPATVSQTYDYSPTPRYVATRTQGAPYNFNIVASDAGGGVSTPGSNPAPSTPTTLVLSNQTPGAVDITWAPTADDGNVTSYLVYTDTTLLGTVTPTNSWTQRNLPDSAEWQVFDANGKYIALGRASNKALVSTNGITWTSATLPTTIAWCGLAYGAGLYVAIGGSGFTATNNYATSPDGTNWTLRTNLPQSTGWSKVAFGAGLFVAVGGSYLATSPDGTTWTQRSTPAMNGFLNVAYGGGKFVAVGPNGASNRAIYSYDGITWAVSNIVDNYWWGLSYGNGRFVAVAYNSTLASYSVDGINWTTSTLPVLSNWKTVAYSNGLFLAAPYNTSGVSAISTDGGATWTSGGASLPGGLHSIGAINGFFVAAHGDTSINIGYTYDWSPTPKYTATIYPSTDYNLNVRAMDVLGTLSPASTSVPLSTGPDSPPEAPSTLAIIPPTTAANVTLEWNPAADNNRVYRYQIYNGETLLGTTPAATSTWTARTLPASVSWLVFSGGGQFVAVGYNSNIAATSPNGITWTQRYLPVGAPWLSVAYGNGTYVAVASGGGIIAATSTDGITWTQRSLPASTQWYSVAYGSGVFVAVATGGTIAASSPDGITWTQRALPVSGNWRYVTYGNGVFVAVTLGPSAIAATSTNGTTWTQQAMPVSADWRSVTYGNGVFVAVASGSAVAATSPTGVTGSWTQRTLPVSANWYSIAYSNGLFMATASGSVNISATSSDGITWTQRTLPASTDWQSVAGVNGFFSAVSMAIGTTAATFDYAATPRAAVAITQGTNYSFNVKSRDEANQISAAASPSVVYNTVPDAPTTPEVVGTPTSTNVAMDWTPAADDVGVTAYLVYNGASLLTTITASATWTVRGLPSGKWRVFSGNNLFIAVSTTTDNRILTSSNGITWNQRGSLPTSTTWIAVAYGNGTYVAVSNTTIAASSTDGIIWTLRTLPSSLGWTSVAYGNGIFVAVNNSTGSYDCATSYDGITWTARALPGALSQYAITFGNGKFVTVNYNSNNVFYSMDGINWYSSSILSTQTWYGITYGNGTFVAFANNSSQAASSTDGVTWTARALSASTSWRSIAYSGGLFVVVGDSSVATSTSPDGATWTTRNFNAVDTWTTVAGVNGFFVAAGATALSTTLDWSPNSQYVATLTQGTNYNFNVKSRDGNSILSAASPSLTYTTVPDAPVLSLASYTPSSATLEWNPVYDDVRTTSYLVYNGANLLQTLTSSGTTWSAVTLPTAGQWRVFNLNNQFMSLGYNSTKILTSPNGLTWTERTLPGAAANWRTAAYGNGVYVAIAYGGTTAAYSTDGVTWTIAGALPSNNWSSVSYGNGIFVAIADGSSTYATSYDGINWTSRSRANASGASMTFGAGKFIILATGTVGYSSGDGINWTAITVLSGTWSSLTYGYGRYVACSFSSGLMMSSPDGITWVAPTSAPPAYGWSSVTYSSGMFVSVASNSYAAYSNDGTAWSSATSTQPVGKWDSVAGVNGLFVSVDNTAGSTKEIIFGASPIPTYTAAVTQGPTYNFTVKARDVGNFLSPASNAVVFATAPDPLASLTVTSITPTTVTLQWTAPTGLVPAAKYNIYNNTTLLATIDAPTTTYTADIVPTASYNFSVRALDVEGDLSGDSPHLIFSGETTKIVDPPAAITFVPGFKIYRNGEYIGTSTSETFTDPAPLEGFNDYTITSFDQYGNESAPSEITTINNDVTPPPVPTNLQLSSTNETITLTWQSVGGATFRVYRNGIYVGSSATLTYTEDAPDGHHEYTVSAVDLAGNESPQTAPVTVDVDATAPTVPTVSVSGTGSSVTVSWDTNPDVYRYQVSRNGAIQGTTVSTSYTQTVADGTYNYTVSARDAVGNWSAESTPAVITVDTTPPPVPTGLSISKAGSSVTFSWGATSGGTTSYAVYRNNLRQTSTTSTSYIETVADGTYNYTVTSLDAKNNESAKSAVKTITVDTIPPVAPISLLSSSTGSNVTLTWAGPGDATSYHIFRDGIQVGTRASASFTESVLDGSYSYRVSALDSSNNEGPLSTASAVVVDTVPPDVPVSVAASSNLDKVTVTWDASAGATLYRVYRDSVHVGSPTSTMFTENVIDGTYEYEVSARDAKGNESAKSAPESVTVFTLHETLPQNLTVKAVGNKVTVDWEAPAATNEGVHTYNVYRDNVMVSHVTRSIHNDTLADGTYAYSVSALNGVGKESPKTASVAITIDTTPPDVPVGLTVSAIGSSVTAYWTPSPSAVSYKVFRNGNLRGSPTAPSFNETTPDGNHNYRVSALDANGNESDKSSIVSVVVDTQPPNRPNAPDTALSGLNITVTWNSPNTATQYRVYRNDVLIASPTEATYVDTVGGDGFYSYTVAAGDPAGNFSAQSSPTLQVVDTQPPGEPLVSVDNLGREFSLDWNAVPDAVLYGIRRNGVSLTTTTDTFLFDVVPADGTWGYEVAARDAYGNWGSYSDPQPIAVVTTPPPTPIAVEATTGAYTTTLIWAPVLGATGYNIARNGVVVGSSTEETFTDVVAQMGVYEYTVRAKDDFGNYSAFTDPVEATVDMYTDLTRPTLGLLPLWQETVGRDPDAEERKFLTY